MANNITDFSPMINGISYNWAVIRLFINGIVVTGVESINYKEEADITPIYGAGRNPVSRAYGNLTRSGSISLHLNETHALTLASKTGSLVDLPEFEIIVTFIPANGTIIKHRLSNCVFLSNSVGMSQNDDHQVTDIDLAIGNINWNA